MKTNFKAPLPYFFLGLTMLGSVSALAGCAWLNAWWGRPAAGAQAGVALRGNAQVLYAAGDIADCRKHAPAQSGATQTAALVQAGLHQDQEAIAITLGDNTYPSGRPAEFNDCYQPSWGQFKARTYPTPGNHDYYTPNASGYYDYFGALAGPAQRGYYSYTLGKWHVLALNSNLKDGQQEAQLAWLKDNLAQNPAACTLAYWHHPLFSSGGHGNNPRMAEVWKLLQAGGADVVLTGHDHDYERFAPQDSNGRLDQAQGIREFVVGTGGAHLSPLNWRRADHSEIADNSTLGVLKLRLRDNGYQWDFLPVDGGTFTDQGAALCH